MFSLFTLIFIASVSKVFTITPVIVLSFDGFHPRFVNNQDTPYLHDVLLPLGARPPYMTSIFPTKTMVTHFTMATGAYPKDHGVYNNKMFDDDGNVVHNKNVQFQTNDKIVPIWIENENTGNQSAVMMWPGSEFTYNTVKPVYITKYNKDIKWEERAKKIVETMTRDTYKPNLMMAYFEYELHYDKSQRDSYFIAYKKKVDDTIKLIHQNLTKATSHNIFNMIILSGHGLEPVGIDNIMILEDIITPTDDIKVISSGSLVFIRPKSELLNEVKSNIKKNKDFEKLFNLYTNDSFPENFKINTKNLNGIIILVAKYGHSFYQRQSISYAVQGLGNDKNKLVIDEDGYDPTNNANMNAFFLGVGPNFNSNITTQQSFNIINVYAILKHLLNIPDALNIYQQHVTLNETIRQMMKS